MRNWSRVATTQWNRRSQVCTTQERRRSVHALWAASVLGGFAQSLAGTAGALLARQFGDSDAVAGLPQALLVVGAAAAALLLSAVYAAPRSGAGVDLRGISGRGRLHRGHPRRSTGKPSCRVARQPAAGSGHHRSDVGTLCRRRPRAGRVARAGDGLGVGGYHHGPDHRSQIERAQRNVRIALEAADASVHDAVKSTMYVVDFSPEVLAALAEASAVVYGADQPTMAVTLVGVAALADPRYKVEIEATAVLP